MIFVQDKLEKDLFAIQVDCAAAHLAPPAPATPAGVPGGCAPPPAAACGWSDSASPTVASETPAQNAPTVSPSVCASPACAHAPRAHGQRASCSSCVASWY